MKLVPSAITQKLGRHILLARKHSPRFLFAAGVVGVVGSTVLACRSTMKLEETLDEVKFDLDELKKIEPQIGVGSYSQTLHNKNLTYVYAKGAMSVVKLYAPAILVGSASIAALTTSHVTLTRRNASLTAAYSGLQIAFDSYRERVKAEIGEERELDIRHAVTKQEIEVDGKMKEIRVADPNKYSAYARIFDETNPQWVKNAELNRFFIQCQQNYYNNLLQARGHVFLNEVYESLGFEHTQPGAVVGWVLGDSGDNFIDFGLFTPNTADFINGYERSIILDFNVDGVIFDKI